MTALFKNLKVKTSVRSAANTGWVQIDITGEDEEAALSLLDHEIGLAPTSAENVGKFSALRGRVVNPIESRNELRVDLGVFEPRIYCAAIPLSRLQAQLSDGVRLSIERLIELFCLHEYAPIHVKILDTLDPERGYWEAELSELQVSRFSEWLESNLDRLIVLGASLSEVEVAVERAGHFRDVVKVEPLGPYEHSILCKLGTESVGLIPKLGPYMGSADLASFSPRKVKQVIGRQSF